jgi:hypothetical protein
MGMGKIIWVIGLSILSGICYRLGGSAKKGNWLDFARNSKTRDVGCSLLSLGLFIGQKGVNLSFWWLYAIAFGASWGFLTTYWDFITGEDNFYLHGLFCGLAFIPLHWVGLSWWVIGIRAIACAVLMGIWSALIGWDIAEEFGRGFILTISIPLLLI